MQILYFSIAILAISIGATADIDSVKFRMKK